MSRFMRVATEEVILAEVARAKQRNINALSEFRRWQVWYYGLEPKNRMRHMLRRKPYNLDPVPGIVRQGKISDELMRKYRRILFSSRFRLERMLSAQEIPWDILKNYKKRFMKDPDLFEGIIYQFIYFGNVAEEFILENWTLIRNHIDDEFTDDERRDFMVLIKGRKGYDELKLLLRLNPIE